MRRLSFVLFLVLIALSFSQAQRIAVKADKLIDPKTGNVAQNQLILVQDGRIVSVSSRTAVQPDFTVIDLTGKTVLPGLIDGHTHILLEPEDEVGFPPVISKSQAFRTIQGVWAAKKDLEAGFTTVRDLDSEGAGFADVALRDAINQDIVAGPRMLVSTLALSITAGHMNNTGLNPDIQIPDPVSLTDSKDAMVAEIRRQVKYGADWIKLYATGTMRHVDPVTLEPLSQVSLEEVQTVVNEAKRWRKDVAAHAYGGASAKYSVMGGVRSIEHGMLLDDETLKLMVEHGTYWCPTLCTYIPDDEKNMTDLRRKIIARHKETFQKAMKMGIKIVFGTDVGAYAHGTSAKEFVKMVEYGMKPIDAIRSATTKAAELIRMEKDLGTIEAGKFADIIAVDGNPLDDISALKNVVFVMKAGKVYKRPY